MHTVQREVPLEEAALMVPAAALPAEVATVPAEALLADRVGQAQLEAGRQATGRRARLHL